MKTILKIFVLFLFGAFNCTAAPTVVATDSTGIPGAVPATNTPTLSGTNAFTGTISSTLGYTTLNTNLISVTATGYTNTTGRDLHGRINMVGATYTCSDGTNTWESGTTATSATPSAFLFKQNDRIVVTAGTISGTFR